MFRADPRADRLRLVPSRRCWRNACTPALALFDSWASLEARARSPVFHFGSQRLGRDPRAESTSAWRHAAPMLMAVGGYHLGCRRHETVRAPPNRPAMPDLPATFSRGSRPWSDWRALRSTSRIHRFATAETRSSARYSPAITMFLFAGLGVPVTALRSSSPDRVGSDHALGDHNLLDRNLEFRDHPRDHSTNTAANVVSPTTTSRTSRRG